MANTSLYQICRLCMAVLDRDAVDCSKDENCELRENIEMIYGVKISASDEFTTKICTRCSDIVVTSTMQYIRVMETQTNIQATLRLRHDISVSLMKTNSMAGKKRRRNEMQIGPVSKRPKNLSPDANNDENNTNATTNGNRCSSVPKSRPTVSPKKPKTTSPVNSATVQMNNQLLSHVGCTPVTSAVNFDLFQLQRNHTKPMPMNNLSNLNINNNKCLLNRYSAIEPSQPVNFGERIQSELSPKKKVINSYTAAEIMRRIVIPPIGGNASRMVRTTNSLLNVANELYKHSAPSRGKVKTSTIVELTRKMAQLRLSGLRGYSNDIWSRVWQRGAFNIIWMESG